MTTRPTLACVVAAYNASETIARTIESILAQTVAPDEILVCDDGSTDDTAAVVERYPSVRLLRQPNRGQAAALNLLASETTADWLVLGDADDHLDPRRIEALRDAITNAPPHTAIISTDAWVHEGQEPPRRYHDIVPWVSGWSRQRISILSTNFLFASSAVRSSAWAQVGGMDSTLRRAQDWDLWIRLIRGGWSASLVDEPLYHYYRHAGSLSADTAAMTTANLEIYRSVLRRSSLTREEKRLVVRAMRWTRVDGEAKAFGSPSRHALLALGIRRPWSRAGAKALVAGTIRPKVWDRSALPSR